MPNEAAEVMWNYYEIQSATPSRLCMIGLVVVYWRWTFLSGSILCFDRKSRQCCFVKTTQDEFFLSGIEADVADRIDSRL